MHHLTPRTPPICRKDHPCIERSASHFQLFPLTMGDRRWARAGRAVPSFCSPGAIDHELPEDGADRGVLRLIASRSRASTGVPARRAVIAVPGCLRLEY